MKKNILGIKIDDVNIDQAVSQVLLWLEKPGKHYIVTPNPEIVLMAQKDKELFKILNNADLSIPDGVGLKLSGDIVCNTPGIDLMEDLIKLASDYGYTVGLLGGREGVAEKVKERLLQKYPFLKIVFAESGGEVNINGHWTLDIGQGNLKSQMLNLKCQMLFVGFGPPKQEKWIAKNLERLNVKVAMVVGGSFDILSGNILRAPKFLRDLGFEWLFRLIIQPWRIKRQLALVKYFFYMIK